LISRPSHTLGDIDYITADERLQSTLSQAL